MLSAPAWAKPPWLRTKPTQAQSRPLLPRQTIRLRPWLLQPSWEIRVPERPALAGEGVAAAVGPLIRARRVAAVVATQRFLPPHKRHRPVQLHQTSPGAGAPRFPPTAH